MNVYICIIYILIYILYILIIILYLYILLWSRGGSNDDMTEISDKKYIEGK